MSLVYKMMKQFLQLGMLVMIMVQPIYPWCRSLASAQVHHEGCLEKCGNVEIPYPFGITESCYLNSDFLVSCRDNASVGSFPLYLGEDPTMNITNISLDGQLTLPTFIGKDCYYRNGSHNRNESNGARLILPYNFRVSNTQNKLFAIGCDTFAVIQSAGDAERGCSSICGNQSFNDIVYGDGTCSGLGCCQTTIPKNILSYTVSVTSFNDHTKIWEHNPCSYVFVAENKSFTFSEGDLMNLNNRDMVPTILDWAIGNSTCENVTNYPSDFACRNNSRCVDSTNGPGYRCMCLDGYKGNPYMPGGCKDIDECAETLDPCGRNTCVNTIGNYTCTCNEGYEGHAERDGGGCQKTLKAKAPVIAITVGIVVGIAAFLIVGSWIYWGYNKRKDLLRRQRFFEQNGGLMLRRELSGKEGYTETAKIFTANELKQATNNFDDSRIIGRGGFGTVYKGILEDDKVIAIKKSKVMNQDQIEQFINEVIVLSQINHRNVVRLLGCCLETEVPLLVYEYVSNGTLHEHIHEKKNPSEVLSWENRLRIAAEVAGVLAYLHSEAVVPIVHRDIKCTNILLDDNCTAKVSDFGASRLVPIDQDMLSTMVQGTIGYLDPEYLHTSQLTEKSDVYSFGVVLVELMTGKKALAFDRSEEERCLAMLFILSMKNDKLFLIIEDGLANDGNKNQIQEAANLALACLRVLGDERPSMRHLASELNGLLLTGRIHPWIDATACSKESEHENEHLLGRQLRDGYHPSDATSCNTSACYDSITDQVVISVGNGR
ncbi:hypothetical protein QQ045_027655 [Rhodiola kirilowii]